jgi:L-ascorbate metabolism protein UlaG (beta-lactamase superfamily)
MCFAPEDFEADFLFSTHEHPDHFDLDSIPAMLKKGR